MHARFVKELLRREAVLHHPSIAWMATPDGSWIELHESWSVLTGRSNASSLGDGWLESLAPAQRPLIERQWRAALAVGAPLKLEVCLMRADGGEQAMLFDSCPVRADDGELHGYIGYLGARSDTEAKLRVALHKAQTALAVHDHFLATISHELRAPLSGIQSWAYVLEQSLGQAAVAPVPRALTGIKTGVDQQVKLLDDLLDAAYVMSPRIALQYESLKPQDLLEEVLLRQQARFEEKQLQLRCEIEADVGLTRVQGDGNRMMQALENIVSNAIRFSEPGGTVVAAIQLLGDEVRIAVTDFGRGIAAHRLASLRNPYPQWKDPDTGESTEARLQPFVSIGLKLTLTRRLLELHDGRLTLDSEGQGKGSEFAIFFPAHRAM